MVSVYQKYRFDFEIDGKYFVIFDLDLLKFFEKQFFVLFGDNFYNL